MLKKLFAGDGASAVRALIRAIVVLITAFVLTLTPEQIGAIQLVLEGFLSLLVQLVPNPTAPDAAP